MKKLLLVLVVIIGCSPLVLADTAEDLCKKLAVEYNNLTDNAQIFLETRLPTAKVIAEDYSPLSNEEEISLLKGKINLLEMEILKLKGGKTNGN